MGLFSGAKTTSTSTTNQVDDRIAASDDATVIQLDSGATLELTDPAAWNALGVVIDTYDGILGSAIDFAGRESDKATDLVTKILDQNKSEDQQSFAGLLKWGAIIALGWAAATALKKG
jgi:hypothetical protein